MAPLTLSNVLIDSVELVQHIKSTTPGAHDSKVIAFGGTYAGTLAALLRIHFPDVFFWRSHKLGYLWWTCFGPA